MNTLSQFNASWADVLNRLQTPIWIFDLGQRCIYWGNTAAVDFWGVSDTLTLQEHDMLSGMSQAMRQRLERYQPILVQGDAITDTWLFYPSGQPRNALCTCSGVYIGECLGVLMEAHPGPSFALQEIPHTQSSRDPLTDLPQQPLLDEFLEHSIAQAQRRGTLVSVLFLEIDDFGDALAQLPQLEPQAMRDLVLCDLAKRLCQRVRKGDLVSRCSSGEFALVITDLRRITDLDILVEKILESVSEPFIIEGTAIQLSLSMGSSLYPRDGGERDILLSRAYAAMYRAKAVGAGAYRPYF